MKKLLLLLSISVFFHFSLNAQTNLFTENFDSYSTTQKLTQQAAGGWWTTWSGTPGSTEDAAITTEQSYSLNNSAKIVTNNDLVLNLNDKTSGRYQIKIHLYVTSNKGAFLGFMQDFNSSNTKFGLTAEFKLNNGVLTAGGKEINFNFPFNTWMLVNTIIDLDDDFATMYIDDTEIASWKWSKGDNGANNLSKLDGIDFWGYTSENGCQNYIDNVEFIQQTTLNAPINLTSSLNEKTITLNWDAPATGTPDAYLITRNGLVIGKTVTTSYIDTTVIYPINYTYSVKAHYAGLGYSPSSNETTETITGEFSQRRVLIEHFTNASCGPCASQNPTLEALLNQGDNHSKVAHIGIHTSWPGTDPMYTFNNNNSLGNARVSFYNVTGVPNAIVGGNKFQGSPASITQNLIDEEYNLPGLFNVTSEVTIKENDSIFIDIEYTSLANFNSGNLKAYVFLIEDLKYTTAPGSNGEKNFPDVMRYMYPDQNGTSMTLPINGEKTNLSFKGKIDNQLGEKLQMVTFIQNVDDKEVYMTYQVEEDFTAPSVTITPTNGANNIELNASMVYTFTDSIRMLDDSEITDPSSLVFLKKDNATGSDVPFSATISADKMKITIIPASNLDAQQSYYTSISEGTVENYSDYMNFAASSTFTTKTALGFEDIINSDKINIYPNPSSDQVFVRLDLPEKTNIKIGIYNESGQLVKLLDKGMLSSGEQIISISLDKLLSGNYILKLSTQTEVYSRKIQIIK